MGMTILITGGTGGVGKNLQTSFQRNNLSGLFVGREGGKYDLTCYDKTRQLFLDTRPTTVVFLSANVGGIGYNKANPASLIRDNLLMGINMLDAAVEFNIRNLYKHLLVVHIQSFVQFHKRKMIYGMDFRKKPIVDMGFPRKLS